MCARACVCVRVHIIRHISRNLPVYLNHYYPSKKMNFRKYVLAAPKQRTILMLQVRRTCNNVNYIKIFPIRTMIKSFEKLITFSSLTSICGCVPMLYNVFEKCHGNNIYDIVDAQTSFSPCIHNSINCVTIVFRI